MVSSRNLTRLAFAAAALGMLPLSAADSAYVYDLKLRGGMTAGDVKKDHNNNKMFGFGLAVSRPYWGGNVFAELAFDFTPGQGKDLRPTSSAIYGPNGLTTNAAGQAYVFSPASSIFLHKESSQGFAVRFGYSAAVPQVQGLSWQAGLSLERYKTKSQFDVTLRPMIGGAYVDAAGNVLSDKDPVASRYYEGATFVKESASVAPGLFVGLTQKVNDDMRFEVNLRNQGYKHYEYAPKTFTGRTADLRESTRRGFVLEVGLALSL